MKANLISVPSLILVLGLLAALTGGSACSLCDTSDPSTITNRGSYTNPEELWRCTADGLPMCFEIYDDNTAVVTLDDVAAYVHNWEETCDGIEVDGEFTFTLSNVEGSRSKGWMRADVDEEGDKFQVSCSLDATQWCF